MPRPKDCFAMLIRFGDVVDVHDQPLAAPQQARTAPCLVGLLGRLTDETSRKLDPEGVEIVVNEIPKRMGTWCSRVHCRPPPRYSIPPRTERPPSFFRMVGKCLSSTPFETKSAPALCISRSNCSPASSINVTSFRPTTVCTRGTCLRMRCQTERSSSTQGPSSRPQRFHSSTASE